MRRERERVEDVATSITRNRKIKKKKTRKQKKMEMEIERGLRIDTIEIETRKNMLVVDVISHFIADLLPDSLHQ